MADTFEETSVDIIQPIKGLAMVRCGQNGASLFINQPDKIVKVSDNEVYAVYGNYKQTITAQGEGKERYGFIETITEVTSE